MSESSRDIELLKKRIRKDVGMEVKHVEQYLKSMPAEKVGDVIDYLTIEIIGKMGDSGIVGKYDPVELLQARFDNPGAYSSPVVNASAEKKAYMKHDDIDEFMVDYEDRRIKQEERYFKVTDENMRSIRQRVIGKVRHVMGEIPDAMLNDIDDEIRNLYEEHGCATLEEACVSVLSERLPITPEIATELLFENPTLDHNRGEITVGQYVVGYF